MAATASARTWWPSPATSWSMLLSQKPYCLTPKGPAKMANSAALEGINGLREIRRSPASHLASALEAGSVQGKVVLAEGPFQTMAGVRVDPKSEVGARIAAATGGLP